MQPSHPAPISSLNLPLTRAELLALSSAAGVKIDERDRMHGMYRDLELRGYLRRIVSFNPKHYARGDMTPRFCWTRTELAESILGRV